MTIGRNEKLALIPLLLSVLIWVVPVATAPGDSSLAENDLPGQGLGDTEQVSMQKWQPGVELLLLGLFSSVAILSLLRFQDRLQDRARQRW